MLRGIEGRPRAAFVDSVTDKELTVRDADERAITSAVSDC
jgi:hypothetical protein